MSANAEQVTALNDAAAECMRCLTAKQDASLALREAERVYRRLRIRADRATIDAHKSALLHITSDSAPKSRAVASAPGEVRSSAVASIDAPRDDARQHPAHPVPMGVLT